MSDSTEMKRSLDAIASSASESLVESRARAVFQDSLRRSLPLLAAIPGLFALAQLGQWTKGEPAFGAPLLAVAVAAAAVPPLYAFFRARAARRRGVPRQSALGEVDRQLRLEGRLLAADEFVALPERTPFEEAAIRDAAERSAEAERARLEVSAADVPLGRIAGRWAAAGAALLALATWFAGWERWPELPVAETTTARAGDAQDVSAAEPREDARTNAQSPAQPLPPEAARKKSRASDPQSADASPEVTQDAKESSGKTGAGRSSGAMSSSAASESKSSPSSAGQKSDPSKEAAKPKPADKKKPKETGTEPEAQERPEDEQSGATAGKGSSKGSNKNPTASDWKSRDQVTDTDDQEIEDDEETDEDEEEQENRGGVQPSLRDRRPPVSRDLQIGFGNRANPDANGRGGPSEQKKSRGVASLVLGVPIPDRIKGRPGPGPTKITQERIEPEAEEASPVDGAGRLARETPMAKPAPLVLDASIRTLVRNYFLRKRATP